MQLEDFLFLKTDVPQAYCEEPRGKFLANWRALACPSNETELSQLLKICSDQSIPIVPYGGGTGLVGGQINTSDPSALCLSLEKFKNIQIDGDSALVGAGVVLDELTEALEGSGFHFPLSLASSGSAQIGGLIATNAGGVNVIRFGNMGDLVLGLRAHLVGGEIVDQTQNLRKDNTGFRLDRLMVGAEGALGVITHARLRLVKVDDALSTCLAPVSSPEKAFEWLRQLQKSTASVNAFELISKTSWQIREEAGMQPTPIGTPEWSVLMEIADEPTGFAAIADELDESVVANSLEQRQKLWQFRETIPLANRKIGAIASHDIALPLEKLSEFIAIMPNKLSALDDVRVNCFGHMGDGNLHYNLFAQNGRLRESYDTEILSRAVYSQVVAMGGSISAEHGIGRAKAKIMRELGQGAKLDLMKMVKQALDPKNIMNPGVFGF